MWTIATSEKYIHHVCLCTSLLLQFLWKHTKCSDISIVMTKYIILVLGIWSSIDCSTCWWTASYVLRLRQIPSVGSFAGWVGKSQVHKYQYLAHLWVHHSYISRNTPPPPPPAKSCITFCFWIPLATEIENNAWYANFWRAYRVYYWLLTIFESPVKHSVWQKFPSGEEMERLL